MTQLEAPIGALHIALVADTLGRASPDALRETVRLLHRAGASAWRLGWRGEEDWPPIVALLCWLLTSELARRGEAPVACPPCEATLREAGLLGA